MRYALTALMLTLGACTAAQAAGKKNVCPQGPATLTGTIGENRIFEAPEYWVESSEPCAINLIELEKADAACVKGAKFSVTGKVEHLREDGDLSLVQIINPEKFSCTK